MPDDGRMMVITPGMISLSVLIREEEDKIFSPQVNRIKQIVNDHNNGLLMHSEFLAAIAATYEN